MLSALAKRLCLLFSVFCFLLSASAAPSGYRIRYVNAEEGTYGGDGLSWATAKNNIQNAIEELNAEVSANPSLRGLVFVAGADRAEGMKYVPTMRSTSDADGSVFNTSFRVYAGIYVYGGFAGNETPDDPDHPELLPNKRIMTNGHTYERVSSDIDADNLGETVRRWNFKYKTVLSGNHSTSPIQFTYDTYRNIYSTSFPLSSYHVVWFATNGKVEDLAGGLVAGETDLTGHYQALRDTALVDGCTIEGGYASNTNLHGHNHAGYGGGAYMVKNSVLRNCIVHHCAATMRGGAVYMDGGGEVERCYIHTSQATGYGMQQGYGGAVCIDYNGSLRHSYIIQSAARIGAGLAICHVPNEYPEATVYPDPEDRSGEYDPYALSTVIANCTSNAEGAGVYLDEGGTLNHCSVVNNKCVGPDVIYYGRRHGRTGGIYVRNGGTIYNTVAWGNESAVNNNVQYASFKDPTTTKKIEVHHSAFSKMDLTDWSSTSREVIVSLANNNFPTAEFHEGNYPMFNQPTTAAGIQYDPDSKTVDPDATAPGEPYQRVFNWHPLSASSLRMKAVQVTDALQDVADAVIHAHTDVDVVGRAFEPVSSIGALARSFRSLQWVLEPAFEPGESQRIPTIFMDPNRVVYDPSNTETSCGYLETEPAGNSWTHPCGNLADAITFFKNALVEGGADGETYYLLNGVRYPHVQILVKQGTLSVAGKGAYISGHARTASIRPGSNMRLYGGFAKELDGTDISKRSPHHYRTSLTADVIFGGYQDHSVHVIAIANQHDVIIDGFHLYSGNANIVKKDFTITDGGKTYELLADGAGIVVNNAMSADDKRIDMTGNIIRNSVIANCSAPEGAAVYVSGGYKYKDGTRFCRAELTIVNTIIRNNTAGDAYGDPDKFVEGPDGVDTDAGIVTSNGNAHVWLRNCDIMNNCGFALKSLKPDEEADTDPDTNPRGYIEIYNSIIFSNGQRIRADRSNISKAVSCKWTADNTISGNYIYLDHDAVKPAMPPFIKCFNNLTRVKSEDHTMGFCYNSETGLVDKPTKLFYPLFANPSRNVGHSEGEDFPMYGGKVNYEPLPTNPIVNGANPVMVDGNGVFGNPPAELTTPEEMVNWLSRSMAYDRELISRTYGGAPDAGAIECLRLPKGGMAVYVTPEGSGDFSGSSWGNAIAGNYIYDVSKAPAESPWDVDGTGTKVLTTDSRYQGGRFEDDNALYPFGEKSNASKTLFQANGNTKPTSAISDGIISNNRSEDYVSGLQYAVEKASAYNTLAADSPLRVAGVDSIAVWVGNGTYTDHKGFIMRNKTTVYGGFPASTYATPSMNERIALMSPDIPRPEAYTDKTPVDYETILQISSEDPMSEETHTLIHPHLYEIDGNAVYQIQQVNDTPTDKTGTNKRGWYAYAEPDKSDTDSRIWMTDASDTSNDKQLWIKVNRLADGACFLYNVGAKKVVNYSHGWGVRFSDPSVNIFTNNNSTPFLYEGKYLLRKGDAQNRGLGTDRDKNGVWTDKKGDKRAQWDFLKVRDITDEEFAELNAFIQLEDIPEEISQMTYISSFKGSGTKIVRKPVLAQPDECLPTWAIDQEDPKKPDGAPSSESDASNTYRYRDGDLAIHDPTYYKEYTHVCWDGFTIRHGFYNGYNANRDGGAGVRMFRGVDLVNCIVRDNYNIGGKRARGGDIYMDGDNSRIVSCFVINNKCHANADRYGGGGYLIIGTAYNSLFANNESTQPNKEDGSGIFLEGALFYNNTVAYNRGTGITHWTDDKGRKTYMEMYNCIVWGNLGPVNAATGERTPNDITSKAQGQLEAGNFKHNYVGNNSISDKITTANNNIWGAAATANPFAAGDDALANYDFRLLSTSVCVNRGVEPLVNFDGSKTVFLPDHDVAFTDRVKDCQVDIGAYEYDGTKAIEPMLFPDTKQAVFYVTQNGSGMATATDPANAACYLKFQKVLDAAGRWRYASYFYQNVENEEPGYTATNFTTDVLTHELELAQARAVAAGGTLDVATELTKLRDYQVVVKLEGDNGTHFSYIPTRTTRTTDNENPNDLEMSLIVPHGIQIEGGYEADFTVDRDPLGRPTLFNGEINNTTLGNTGNVYNVVTFTNDLFNEYEHIYMDGDNQVHGQLAFLADADTFLPEGTDAEKTAWVNGNRAVLDGVFIENGFANGTTDEERRGAGAVVTDYAHVRNCVVQNNEAGGMGGGLYLEPAALVSGCIVKNNSAYIGGGIYVQDPVGSEPGALTYVHVFSTTVVGNNAETTAGGLWFDMNLRANSSAFWMNRANDLNNIAGILNTDESQIADNYPLNYCGVESRRVNGVNNIELPVAQSEGVRWDHLEPHEQEIHAMLGGTDIVYYPITLSSVLGRSGMTYAAYEELRKVYPTLELTDIAGLKRMAHPAEDYITLATGATFTRVKKDNAFIEMGARVLNGSFELKVELSHIMTRLFVTTTEELPTEAALALQQNTVEKELEARGESFASGTPAYKAVENDVEMYKQMGSSFLNPFHRFGDALEYIIKVRKSTEDYVDADGNYRYYNGEKMTVGDVYKDVRFEVYVGGGTFYPYRDAHGKQGEARSNTFVVPEEVTIVGGLNPLKADHHYCQERSGTKQVASYSLDCVETQQIRDGRTRMDRNGNHVMEPWEMEHQTILSGNAVNIDARTNVYHVITCFSDEDQVGKLPTRRNGSDDELPAIITGTPSTGERLQNLESESSSSRDLRTILIDGVTVTGGHANDMEQTDVTDNFQKLTYFRGGGIFIDGNWDNSFDSKIDLPEVLSVARRDIPMIVANCLFQDNLGGNGGGVYTNGTFYAFSCHFTKNTARGPNTSTDQNYIPWTAGGAIANNYFLNVWNSLFDNNEAKAGDLPITVGTITNANLRQGYGGAISCSETGLLRIANCDFVRNKAVAYPALYNFIDNNIRAFSGSLASTPEHRDYYGAGHHFAVNTIFWGNQATATTIAPANDIEAHYYRASPTCSPLATRNTWSM